MATRAGIYYLERKRIFTPLFGQGAFATNSLHSHFRPVHHNPRLLGADTPGTRVITQEEGDRLPYLNDRGGFDIANTCCI